MAALQGVKGLSAPRDANGNVSELRLYREPDSEAMAHLAAFRNVRNVVIENLGELDAGADKVLAAAADCPWWPDIKVLSICQSKVSVAGLRVLRRLHSVRQLGLWSTNITAEGLANVARLHNLESLGLVGNRLTADGVKHLAGLRNLEELNLAETDLTDQGVAHIAGLTRLKRLVLEANPITDAAMPHLKGLTNLDSSP